MKKLIMFVMVMAISATAPATIEDLDPPQWGSTQPAATLVYQLDEDGDYEGGNVEPTCLSGSNDFYTDLPDATWADGVLSTEGDTFFALQIPAGSGENITIRAQSIISDDAPWEYIVEQRNEGAGWLNEVWSTGEDAASDLADDLYVLEGTMAIEPDAYWATVSIIGDHHEIEGVILDVIVHDGDAPDIGDRISTCFVQPIFVVDPNVMTVYETGETEGDFGISLYNQPPEEDTITVTVDPNANGGGLNEDMILIGGSPTDGSITLTFDANNFDVPQIIRFKAIDDEIAEPPDLLEPQPVLVSSSYPGHPTDANFVGVLPIAISVEDNDQANIMFRVTPPRGGAKASVIGPVQLWEEEASAGIKWRKIGMQLQVQPSGGPVKLNAEVTGEIEGDNLPPTDPCLPLQEADDPNCFTYTSTTSSNGLPAGCPDHDLPNKTTCWNVDQNIKIWGNDDDVLQVEAFAEGDQNYQAVLEVTVIDDGGDERYADLAEDDPKTVRFNIEDNECGAFGTVPMDVSNRFYMTDPNYGAGDSDCHVDVYDVIEFAKQWMDCSDPKDEDCTSYLD